MMPTFKKKLNTGHLGNHSKTRPLCPVLKWKIYLPLSNFYGLMTSCMTAFSTVGIKMILCIRLNNVNLKEIFNKLSF